jgi:hypothetical protein
MWLSSSFICSHSFFGIIFIGSGRIQNEHLVLLSSPRKSKRPWEPNPMAFVIKRQKSHGDQLTHPWLPFAIWIDLRAWMSLVKKAEVEIEI